MKRPHADLIKQWADDTSLVIESFDKRFQQWREIERPVWDKDTDYRIKPKTQKVKLLAWYGNHSLHWYEKDCYPPDRYTRVPSEDKEIEVEL